MANKTVAQYREMTYADLEALHAATMRDVHEFENARAYSYADKADQEANVMRKALAGMKKPGQCPAPYCGYREDHDGAHKVFL